MSTSHANGRRAVEEETNAASRGFKQVAGEASRDIQVRGGRRMVAIPGVVCSQNVESENLRNERDLSSKMASSARKGQELQGNLADVRKPFMLVGLLNASRLDWKRYGACDG